MIVTRRDGALQLVQQVEHGRVAGELAAAWGTVAPAGDLPTAAGAQTFTAPSPLGAVRTAAARHDDGWRAWDARVLFDEAERRPLHFTDIEAGEHVRLYRQGVESVSLADVYAGVLVGMHWTGLYRGRWSAPGAAPRIGRGEADRRLQDGVVAEEERRWIAAKQAAWTERRPRALFEAELWHNYELLQLWDLLSLYLAVTPPDRAGPGTAPVPWGPQLREVEHAVVDVLLPAVGTRPGGPRTVVTAAVRSPGEVTLTPFPFAAPLEVQVERTVLPDRAWSHAEVAERVRTTPTDALTWRLVPPPGGGA